MACEPSKTLIDSKKAKMGLIGGTVSGILTGLIIAWLTAHGVEAMEAAKVALAVSGSFLTPILAAILGQSWQDTAREKANGKSSNAVVPLDITGAPDNRGAS